VLDTPTSQIDRRRAPPPDRTTLLSRNVWVDSRRTSMRLEPEMWQALQDIARREALTVNALCAMVNTRRRQSSLTSAMRVFVLAYYRNLTAELPNAPRRAVLDRTLGPL
jgi:predicted DNA-binding ribbon-helix-helix protein